MGFPLLGGSEDTKYSIPSLPPESYVKELNLKVNKKPPASWCWEVCLTLLSVTQHKPPSSDDEDKEVSIVPLSFHSCESIMPKQA